MLEFIQAIETPMQAAVAVAICAAAVGIACALAWFLRSL